MASSKKTAGAKTATRTTAKKSERPRIKSSHGTAKPAEGRARKAPAKAKSASGRASKPVAAGRESKLRSGAARPALPKLKNAKGPPVRSLGRSSLASDAAREIATAVAVAAMDKKAVGLEILDVAGKVDYADFLVIMTGRSDRQVQALAFGIEEALKKKGVRLLAVEGMQQAAWVLMDYGDVVVHVFQDEARSLYDIEGLWMDALRLPVPVPAS